MLLILCFPCPRTHRVGLDNGREREETDSSRSRKKSVVYVIDI